MQIDSRKEILDFKEEVEAETGIYILSGRLHLRHMSSTNYHVYIRFDQTKVIDHYCSCKSGMRTNGCCTHIAAFLYYFGCGKHNIANHDPYEYFESILAASTDGQIIENNDDEVEEEDVMVEGQEEDQASRSSNIND